MRAMATRLCVMVAVMLALLGCPAAPGNDVTVATVKLRLAAIEQLDLRYQEVRVPARQACDAGDVAEDTCEALRKAGLAYDRAYSDALAASVTTTDYEAAMIELGLKLALVEGAWKLAQEEIE